MKLEDLIGAVQVNQVHAMLLARAPGLLEPAHDNYVLYSQTVAGVATEVAPLAGDDTQLSRFNLAVWAVALGTASQLEAALFPEQQGGMGDQGRAEFLNRRFQRQLDRLAGSLPDDPVGGAGTGVGSTPRGSFPDPEPYPDPAREAGLAEWGWGRW